MKLLTKRFRKDNRGLSLVELICAVGILTLVSAAIGSAMAMSADSYRKGSTEAGLQQEAQFAANSIGNLIISSNNSVEFTGGVLTVKNTAADSTQTEYKIWLDGTELKYELKQGAGAAESGVIAEGVSSFNVDTTDFAKSRNALVEVEMTKDGKKISADYNITSRNDPTVNDAAAIQKKVEIQCEDEFILEPNEMIEIPVTVHASKGASTEFKIDSYGGRGDTSGSKAEKNGSNLKIYCGQRESNDFTVVLTTADTSSDVISYPKTITVHVRRVTAVDITTDEPKLLSGEKKKANSVYELEALQIGSNLDSMASLNKDAIGGYVSPYTVSWSFSDASKVTVLSQIDEGNDSTHPYIRFKLNTDVTNLTVRATAKHPEGKVSGMDTNRSGVRYGQVSDPSASVYDEAAFKSNAFWIDSDFMRGHDWNGVKFDSSVFDALQPSGQYMFRFAYCRADLDATGTKVDNYVGSWSRWLYNGDGGNGSDGIWLRPANTKFELNPMYDYAVRVAVCKRQGSERDGDGQKEYELVYPVTGWSDEKLPKPENVDPNNDVWVTEFIVPRITFRMESFTDSLGRTIPAGYSWTAQNYSGHPKNSSDPYCYPVFTADQTHWIDIYCNASHMGKFTNGALVSKLYKKTDGNMNDLTTGWTEVEFKEVGYNGSNTPYGSWKFRYGSSGFYKAVFDFGKTGDFYREFGEMTYDHTDDMGVFYFYQK